MCVRVSMLRANARACVCVRVSMFRANPPRQSVVRQAVRIMIREGWTNRETGKVGAPRMQYLHFEMLQNTVENNAKKLTLQLEISQLKNESVLQLKEELKSFKGDKQLMFNVYDSEKKVKLTLNSKKQKVKITPELLKLLDEKQWLYKLN